ncbi:hypothetical protein L873DRAFT_1804145 [Choiromyces venosus 120613-1]|uniref:Uncharacterized protein n=1 Tax=Choiromyces venosus 120613-1 TaxID=1336337 RepID=A0A3N4JVK7_9PEZI|nr:hypothetical protein L873DRAFT_1804145 [Choiromyces venosus 120613-1]
MFSPDSGYYKAPTISAPLHLGSDSYHRWPHLCQTACSESRPDWAVVQVAAQPMAKKRAIPNGAGFYVPLPYPSFLNVQ